MPDAQTDRIHLLQKFIDGVIAGELSLSDIEPTPDLSGDLIAKGWRNAITTLRQGAGTEELLRSVRILRRADPEFPGAGFVLGLACLQAGTIDEARIHLEHQAGHPEGLYAEASARVLASLEPVVDG